MTKRPRVVVVALLALAASTVEARKYRVDGTRFFAQVKGQGSPAVVFDAGLGIDHHTWDDIRDSLLPETRTFVYDRAGIGGSRPVKGPRVADRMVAELRALLLEAGVPPPYVLVGHSLGGLNMRLFAARHPGEVVGLVLVEATPVEFPDCEHELYTEDERARIATNLALPGVAGDEWRGASRSAWLVARESVDESIPVIVLSSDRAGEPETFRERWQEMQRQMAAELQATHRVVPETGHYLHYDAPATVHNAILELVRRARAAAARAQ